VSVRTGVRACIIARAFVRLHVCACVFAGVFGSLKVRVFARASVSREIGCGCVFVCMGLCACACVRVRVCSFLVKRVFMRLRVCMRVSVSVIVLFCVRV
jgi:hypothetical protein